MTEIVTPTQSNIHKLYRAAEHFFIRLASIEIVGAILFAFALKTYPLYWSNQNTKFLHGLARAFPDQLGNDWTANTVDGLPAFSWLVFLIARHGHSTLFYVIEFALLACLFYSCVLLSKTVARATGNSAQFQMSFAAVLVFLSATNSSLGIMDGVAGQYLVGGFLQPSEFGVIFVLSIALLAAGRVSSALVLAAVPATIHPGYALSSLIIVAGIVIAGWLERRAFPPALSLVLTCCLLIVPQIDLFLRFAPTSADTFKEAARILAFERIPHHSLPSHWFGWQDAAKFLLAAVAIYLSPRRSAIQITIAALLACAIIGTIVVAATENASLAIVAPWRTSVVIVPVSLVVVLSRLIEWSFLQTPYFKAVAIRFGIILLLVSSGCSLFRIVTQTDIGPPSFIEFVADHSSRQNVYLTSPVDESFRLKAMTAQFVSWKSHPYLDAEVIEWRKRILLARAVFTEAEGRDIDCNALERLLSYYRVTHVLIQNPQQTFACPILEPIFSSAEARIFHISGQ